MTVQRRKRSISGGARSYRGWKNWTAGDILVGRFVNQSVDQYDKPNYHIEVIETDFAEEEENVEAGKKLVLNSCGSLDYAMEQVEIGMDIEIIYQGTTTLEKGKYKGKECHTVEVSEVLTGEDTSEEQETTSGL